MSDLETQLYDFWKADAAVWRKRTSMFEQLVGEPDKIAISKVRENERQLLKDKQERMASGGKRGVRKIRGVLAVVESADRLCSPTAHCTECGRPFTPSARQDANRSYCSQICRQRAKAFRSKVREAANG